MHTIYANVVRVVPTEICHTKFHNTKVSRSTVDVKVYLLFSILVQ